MTQQIEQLKEEIGNKDKSNSLNVFFYSCSFAEGSLRAH